MNGVHCQISDTSMAIFGAVESQSTWGAPSEPKSFQIALRVPLSRP